MDGLAHAAVAAAPPSIALEKIERAVYEQFGLRGDYTPLVSERDQNFHLRTAGSDQYVVKVTSALEPGIVSEFQIAALLHLQQTGHKAPRVIKTLVGTCFGNIREGDCDCMLRLVSYLPGKQLSSVIIDREMAYDFGTQLARLDAGLRSFSHPGDQPVLLWDLQRALELRELLVHIDDAQARCSVAEALDDFEAVVFPRLGELRTQVIHGDANPGNILIDPASRRTTGFIDFGDMIQAPLVFDPAIAAAYLRGKDANPLELITPFLAGFSAATPLQDIETVLLFDLIRARLATTITLLFWRLGARHADDPYREKTLRDEAGAMRFLSTLNALGRADFSRQVAPGGGEQAR